jgi:hypothetical protein
MPGGAGFRFYNTFIQVWFPAVYATNR